MASSKRINFDVSPEQDAELAWLRDALGAASTKDTVLRAVRVLAVLSRETRQGAHLYVQTLNGESVRLLLPELETVGPDWNFLVQRPHHWRKQPYIKGTRMRASNVWNDIVTNQLTPEDMAEDLQIPLPAIQEAIAWCELNQDLLRMEADEERRQLNDAGVAIGPDSPR